MTDDVEQVNRKRLLREDREKHSIAELNDVLSTYSGRAVLCAILKECDAKVPTHSLETFRALGKQDVGRWLKDKLLTVNRDSVILMENEERKRDENLQA